MENKSIIIILVAVILVLACILGVMFLQPNAKQATKVKITSDKSQYEGGKLEIQLTDKNKTPISKEIVNVTVTNKKGKSVVDNAVKTNLKGKAKLDLHLKKGKYDVEVAYGGNENFTASNSTQKLTIKEKVKETASTSQSTGNAYVDRILNDPSCTVVHDPYSICPKHGVPYWQDKYCDWAIQPF